jgi:hypothetical protein
MYTPRWFDIRELVPPEVWDIRGQASLELFDPEILRSIDSIRDDYGRILVNNWHTGGDLKYRGFRPQGCPVGAAFSQHRYGRAIDLTPLDTPLETVYEAIRDGLYDGITTIENIEATRDGNWIHVDCRNNRAEAVRIVEP